jgi:hypothetical protein
MAQVPFGPSAFNEAVPGQRRVSNRHRQAVADLVHLRRNAGPKIAITAMVRAPADPRHRCLLLSALRTQVRHSARSEKCQHATSNIQLVQKKKLPKAVLSLLPGLFTKASLGACQFSDYRAPRTAD